MVRTGWFHYGHFPPPHFWRRAAHDRGHVPLSLVLLPHRYLVLRHHLSARQSRHLPTHFHCWRPQFVGCPHHYACRDAGDHPGGHDGAVLAGHHRRSLHRQMGVVIRVISLTIIFRIVIGLVGFLRLTMVLTAVLMRL